MRNAAGVARPTRRFLRFILICLLVPAGARGYGQVVGQAGDPQYVSPKNNPLSAWNKHMYGQMKTILLQSAEKMPEENYSFKPTDAVRSFGQLVGHLADAQYTYCAVALAEKTPIQGIEQSKTSKADLIAALKASFVYCDKAYDAMTDTSGAQTVNLFGGQAPRLGALTANTSHAAEHYGNMVTYMRLKNIVPPNSGPGPAPPTKN